MKLFNIPLYLICMCSVVSVPLGSIHAQPVLPEIEYFMTTEDFTANNAGKESVVPSITLETPELLKIPKWIDKSTGKNQKPSSFHGL